MTVLDVNQARYIHSGAFMGAAKDRERVVDLNHLSSAAKTAFEVVAEKAIAAGGCFVQVSERANAATHEIQWSTDDKVLTAIFDDLSMTENLEVLLKAMTQSKRPESQPPR